MALSHNPLPNAAPTRALPIDAAMLFSRSKTYTYADQNSGNANPLNSSTGTYLHGDDFTGDVFLVQVDLGGGRFDGLWVVDLETLKVSDGNEYYSLALLGSNDPAFGAGNMDLAAFHDWSAPAPTSTGFDPYLVNPKMVAPFLRAQTPAVPAPGLSIRRHVFPFSNNVGGYTLKYFRVLLFMTGTAPSIRLSSWICPADR